MSDASRATPLTQEHFLRWLALGERGLSSEAIVIHLTDKPLRHGRGWGDHPVDPSDFRRCELLLRQVPVARFHLRRMAEVSREWAALVDHWDEIVALIESEAPGAFEGTPRSYRAPAAYQRMRELLTAAVTP